MGRGRGFLDRPAVAEVRRLPAEAHAPRPAEDAVAAFYARFIEGIGNNLVIRVAHPSPNADPGLGRRSANVVWMSIIVE